MIGSTTNATCFHHILAVVNDIFDEITKIEINVVRLTSYNRFYNCTSVAVRKCPIFFILTN